MSSKRVVTLQESRPRQRNHYHNHDDVRDFFNGCCSKSYPQMFKTNGAREKISTMVVEKEKRFRNYNEVYCGKDSNCPISAPVSISQESPNKRCKVTCACPCVDISCSENISFMQSVCKIVDKIFCNTIISKTFTTFCTYKENGGEK